MCCHPACPPQVAAAVQVCYHGPVEAVLPFFEGLGFRCPPRRGVADFLQEVTTPSDQQVRGPSQGSGSQEVGRALRV